MSGDWDACVADFPHRQRQGEGLNHLFKVSVRAEDGAEECSTHLANRGSLRGPAKVRTWRGKHVEVRPAGSISRSSCPPTPSVLQDQVTLTLWVTEPITFGDPTEDVGIIIMSFFQQKQS